MKNEKLQNMAKLVADYRMLMERTLPPRVGG